MISVITFSFYIITDYLNDKTILNYLNSESNGISLLASKDKNIGFTFEKNKKIMSWLVIFVMRPIIVIL